MPAQNSTVPARTMIKREIFLCYSFKCAGTTTNSILELNQPNNVLCAQKPNGSRGKSSSQPPANFLVHTENKVEMISSHSSEPICTQLPKISLTCCANRTAETAETGEHYISKRSKGRQKIQLPMLNIY